MVERPQRHLGQQQQQHVKRHAGKAHRRQGFRQQAAAAADIEKAKSLERALGPGVAPEMLGQRAFDEAQPDGIEFVQRLEFAGGIPPFLGHAGEAFDFVGGCGGSCVHRGSGLSLR